MRLRTCGYLALLSTRPYLRTMENPTYIVKIVRCTSCERTGCELYPSAMDTEFGREPEMVCDDCADREDLYV